MQDTEAMWRFLLKYKNCQSPTNISEIVAIEGRYPTNNGTPIQQPVQSRSMSRDKYG